MGSFLETSRVSAALYPRLVGARLRAQLAYPASFALQVVATFASTASELLAIVILFDTFGEMGGWTKGEVAFLYGLVSVAFGITEMVGAGFDDSSRLVRTGEYDRVLTRPIAPFIQVLAADFELRRVGRISQGLLALALAQQWAGIEWTVARAAVFGVGVLSSSVVFFSVIVVGAAVCFWTVETTELQNVFTYGGTELGSYPLHIYNRWMRSAFLYLVPLGLTSYYPALYVLGEPDPLGLPTFLRFAAPLVAATSLAAALWAWRLGLRHYQSTGS